MNQDLSKTITFLRFPLMAALVFDHFNITSYAVLNGSTCEWPVVLSGAFEWIVLLISEILGTAVVPFCFVISGILFFASFDGTVDNYGNKIKRRLTTLVIPYLIWNSLWLLYLAYRYFKGVGLEMHLSVSSILASYWNESLSPLFTAIGQVDFADGPIYNHFWYVKYLMVLIVLSPLVYVLIKRCFYLSLLITGLLWLLHPGVLHESYQFSYFGFGGFFLFMFGGGITLNKIHLNSLMTLKSTMIGMLAFVSMTVVYIAMRHSAIYNNIHRVMIMITLVFVYQCSYAAIKKGWTFPKYFSDSFFMIYALHLAILPFFMSKWSDFLQPETIGLQLAVWIATVFSSILVCVLFDIITKRFTSGLNKLLTGGR